MDIERLHIICKKLPSVTEGIKWGNDLCFMVGEKMFCVAVLEGPLRVSFKVPEEEFEELCAREGIIPAPYVARYHWVLIEDMKVFKPKEWEHYIARSYQLVKSKLPKKVLAKLN